MKVTVRQKPMSNGSKMRLYLDIYRSKNERYKEKLELWLYTNPSSTIERTHNTNTRNKANQISAKRTLEIQDNFYGMKSAQGKYRDFVHYFEMLTRKRESSGINFNHWFSTYKHLKEYSISQKCRPSFHQINKEWLEDFKEYLLERISQNSAASYFNILRHGIHEAMRDKLISEDPLRYVQSPKTVEAIRDYLTIDELRMLAQTPCKEELYKRAFIFGCFTGLRISDMLKLKWKEVKYNDEVGYHIVYKQQKTQLNHILPISEQALDLLGDRQNDEDFVFQGLTYSDRHNRMLKHWALDAGIRKNVTFHIARHTFATLQLSNGTDLYTVCKLLGHRKVSTTQIYAKIIDETKRRAVDNFPVINVSL